MRRGTGSQSILIRSVAVATATVFALTGFAVAQLGGLLPLPDINPAPIVSTGEIDPVLSSVLQSATSDQLIQAVVTLDHHPIVTDLLAFQATGVQVRPFRALPMVATSGLVVPRDARNTDTVRD